MKYLKEKIEAAVKKSKTWAEVCRELDAPPATGSQSYIKHIAERNGFDYSHFVGRFHRKGKVAHNRLESIDKYLCRGSIINSHRLKEYLFRLGYKEKRCERCKRTRWLGEEIVFELDHIDNDKTNNELSNLKILCPNCHSLKTRSEIKKRKTKKTKIASKPMVRKLITVRKQRPRKVVRPSSGKLQRLIDTKSFCAVGRMYGVSDNAIRKWCKSYNLKL